MAGIVQSGLIYWLDVAAQRYFMRQGQPNNAWRNLVGDTAAALVSFEHTESSGWSVDGLRFDGINDHCTLPDFGISGDLTVEITVKCSSLNSAIIGNTNGFCIGFYNEESLILRPAGQNQRRSTVDHFIPGGWNHILVAYDSAGVPSVYINGQEEDYLSANGWNSASNYIGRRGNTYFSGEIGQVRIYRRALSELEILQNYHNARSLWLPPKLDWTVDDFYNYEELNRVEIDTVGIVDLMSAFGSPPVLTTETIRTMKRIEFADSLNRIESNIDRLKQRFKPKGWIPNKLDWKSNDPFDYKDAARLENNLALLHFYYRGNVDNFRYCGAYICGEEVI